MQSHTFTTVNQNSTLVIELDQQLFEGANDRAVLGLIFDGIRLPCGRSARADAATTGYLHIQLTAVVRGASRGSHTLDIVWSTSAGTLQWLNRANHLRVSEYALDQSVACFQSLATPAAGLLQVISAHSLTFASTTSTANPATVNLVSFPFSAAAAGYALIDTATILRREDATAADGYISLDWYLDGVLIADRNGGSSSPLQTRCLCSTHGLRITSGAHTLAAKFAGSVNGASVVGLARRTRYRSSAAGTQGATCSFRIRIFAL